MRTNQQIFNRLHVLMDLFLIVLAYIVAWFLKFEVFYMEIPTSGKLDAMQYFSALLFIVPGYCLLYFLNGVYTPRRTTGIWTEVVCIIKANSFGLGIFMIILYVAKIIDFSRSMIFVFYGLSIIFGIISRIVVRSLLKYFRKMGYNCKYILMIGYSRAAEEYINRILNNPQWGYVIRGILDDKIPAGTEYKGVKVIGLIDNLEVILPQSSLDEIAITLPLKDYERFSEIVGKCEKSGVHTKFIPDYAGLVPSSPYIEDLEGLPIINIRRVPLTNVGNQLIKRLVDLIVSLCGIIISLPVLFICAIVVKCSSRGPIIFKQERIGLQNKPFYMYKFRTMKEQVVEDEEKAWTVKGDCRVTKVGKLLRKTSMDELPQLFNILMGNMSIVGPRPERPQFVEKFKEDIPRYMVKHQVRPGLTGWAQVNGYRGDTSIKKRIEHDIYYIENWTLSFDFKIMVLTLFTGIINKNAY